MPRTTVRTRQLRHLFTIRPAIHPFGRKRRTSKSMGYADGQILEGVDGRL